MRGNPKFWRWSTVLAVVVVALISAAGSSRAELTSGQKKLGAEAFRAADRGDWSQAHHLIALVDDPLAAKLMRWYEIIAADGYLNFRQIKEFVEDNPHWPRQRLMRQRTEEAIQPTNSVREILSWFHDFEPITTQGKVSLARALLAVGNRQQEAAAAVRRAWIDGQFSSTSERAFLKEFGGSLNAAAHRERLDRLLWQGRRVEAERMLPRVDEATQAVAFARMELRTMRPGVDYAISRVPASLRSDPGLVYERVRWRRKKGLDADASSLLLSQARDSIEPERWWTERQILARRALADGHPTRAYRIASSHGLKAGSGFAEAEWLSGFIAFRFLNDPKAARQHFERLYSKVNYPISLARGAYWAGRAAEAGGDERTAERWYLTAAEHPATFYGQLAASRLRPGKPLALPPDPVPSTQQRQSFDVNELVVAARILYEFDQKSVAASFLVSVAAMSDAPGWKALAAGLAERLGRPDLAVVVAKKATRRGDLLIGLGYPSVAVPKLTLGVPHDVEPPLVLAMIRQESAYRADAVSRAGARGLMQLMPGTAQEVAAKLNVPYSAHRLIADRNYNLTLGQSYIGSMLARFGGSYVLALAAYNAGPYRVRQWLSEIGDPRSEDLDRAIDWIELIPFSETRNYVQRILEHLQVYRGKVNGGFVPASLERDLQR